MNIKRRQTCHLRGHVSLPLNVTNALQHPVHTLFCRRTPQLCSSERHASLLKPHGVFFAWVWWAKVVELSLYRPHEGLPRFLYGAQLPSTSRKFKRKPSQAKPQPRNIPKHSVRSKNLNPGTLDQPLTPKLQALHATPPIRGTQFT